MTHSSPNASTSEGRVTKIKYKLTLAIMSIVLILMLLTTFINQRQLEQVIYRDYEHKGVEDATLTYNLSFQSLIESAENYTNFLTLDSNVNRAVYYLIALGVESDVVDILPQYTSKLGLSFLEVVDLNGSIRFSALENESKSDYEVLAPLVSSAREGLQVTRLSYDEKLNQFLIHSTSLVMRKNEPIAVLHGGYVLDADLLSTLSIDHGLALYNSSGELVTASRPGQVPVNTDFVDEIYSEAVNACFNSESDACNRMFISSSFQLLDDVTYLYTAMPVRLNNDLPVGSVVVSHDMGFMEGELAAALERDLLLFIAMALFGLFLSFYMSRRLASPLVTLSGLIQAYGEGKNISLRGVKRDTYEIDSLVVAFREMIKVREAAEAARQASEDQVSLLLKSTGEAIFGMDLKGVCTFANPACAESIGVHSVSSLIGQDCFKVIFGAAMDELMSREATQTVVNAHLQGVAIYTEDIELKRADDGEVFPAEFHVSPIYHDAEHVGSVVTFSDISERKAIERKSQQLNEELEKKVNQRTQELRAANTNLSKSLEQLSQAQEQLVQSEKMASLGSLVAGVAHEINTPIGVGLTAASHLENEVERYIELYQQEKLTKNDFEKFMKTAAESSHIVASNLQRAGELIKSFKQVAVDQSSNDNRVFLITQYIEEVLRSLRPHLSRTAIEVKINGPKDLQVTSCPGLYSQIITNLVMNSIIHAFGEDESGMIDIDVVVDQGHLHIYYRDNGKGMDGELVKKVFDPFITTKRGSGGTGLGMHVVYNVVTQGLGGTIRCASVLGQGTEFFIDVPVALSTKPISVAKEVTTVL